MNKGIKISIRSRKQQMHPILRPSISSKAFLLESKFFVLGLRETTNYFNILRLTRVQLVFPKKILNPTNCIYLLNDSKNIFKSFCKRFAFQIKQFFNYTKIVIVGIKTNENVGGTPGLWKINPSQGASGSAYEAAGCDWSARLLV